MSKSKKEEEIEKEYMTELSHMPTPLEYVEYVMDQMDFKQIDLVRAGCGTGGNVSEMLNRKRKLTLNFIRKFLKISHREKMAYMLVSDYKLKKKKRT